MLKNKTTYLIINIFLTSVKSKNLTIELYTNILTEIKFQEFKNTI